MCTQCSNSLTPPMPVTSHMCHSFYLPSNTPTFTSHTVTLVQETYLDVPSLYVTLYFLIPCFFSFTLISPFWSDIATNCTALSRWVFMLLVIQEISLTNHHSFVLYHCSLQNSGIPHLRFSLKSPTLISFHI